MSTYKYTFINISTKEQKEVVGFNLWNAIYKLGMIVSRVDRLSGHYLQTTPFEQRERKIWGGEYGMEMYIVKQKYNK